MGLENERGSRPSVVSLRFLEYFRSFLRGELSESRRDGQTLAGGFYPREPRSPL
jgi:hypothetical protein